ncbi:N-acetyltransferase GCN5 [Yersinia kristensenii]|nr:N-acetyltransferase GCN5 [Yersinia kristensenii]
MKKLLFLPLFIVIISGSAKSNGVLPDESKNYSFPYEEKVQEIETTCFYSEDNYQGEAICLNGSKKIDLYNAKDNYFNDQISSITIPKNLSTTIYKNDHYNPPHYTLMETINGEQLKSIGMHKVISGISIENSGVLPCIHNCVILEGFNLSLRDIFKNYWNLSDKPNKQILLNFLINNKTDLFIDIKGYFYFMLENKKLTISAPNKTFSFYLKDKTQDLSLLFKIENNVFSTQYIESIGTNMTNSSPMIDFHWPFTGWSSTQLSILNFSDTPQILRNITMTANTNNTRVKRDLISKLACWGIPALAIYNYVVQGRCNQLDKLTHKLKDLFHGDSIKIAGHADMLPLAADVNIPPLSEIAPGTQILDHIDTNIKEEGLTLPATARYCGTTLAAIIHERYPRQPMHPCPQWVSQSLADFTLLFGYNLHTWSGDYLHTLINNIITHQRINIDDEALPEYHHHDTEQRLIHSITTQVRELGQVEVQNTLARAFEYSQQNYANYLTHAVGANAQPLLPPQAVQELPLGYYELDLLSYNFQDTQVRVLHNNQWVASTHHFEVDVIDGSREETQSVRDAVLTVINQWKEKYSNQIIERDGANGELTPESAIIEAGQILSHTIASGLTYYLGLGTDQFFIVRLNGEIVSILQSDSIHNSDNAEITASLTHPDYVLRPNAEGTIRGAGTAAVREMARYMQAKGRKKIISDVLSQPSAMVKSKLGFHSIEL